MCILYICNICNICNKYFENQDMHISNIQNISEIGHHTLKAYSIHYKDKKKSYECESKNVSFSP